MKKKELRAQLRFAFLTIEKMGGVIKQTQDGGFCVELPDNHETKVKKLTDALESRGHTVNFLDDGTLEVPSPIANATMSDDSKAQTIAELSDREDKLSAAAKGFQKYAEGLRDKNKELAEEVKELGEYAETLREILEKKEKQVEMLSMAIEKMGYKIESSSDGKTLFITEPLGNERFARAAYDNAERVKELEAELAEFVAPF